MTGNQDVAIIPVDYQFNIVKFMTTAITIAQMISAIVLMILILLQNKEGGLSGVFGGSGAGNIYRTKRGMEKTIFILTIIFAVLFLGLSLANILLQA